MVISIKSNSPNEKVKQVCSEQMQEYFQSLDEEMDRAYKVAIAARQKGNDPELEPEIPPAEDLAARVEELVGPEGIAPRIRKLTEKYADSPGARELVSLEIAREIARETPQNNQSISKEGALDQAVRTGLAILTEGILVAPLEGVADVKIGNNTDGTKYVALYYAGPIRSAGGTAQALSILIADVVRRDLGIGVYRPTESEVNRYIEEIPLYSQVQRSLQYKPSPKEIDLIIRNCPVCIDGEGTEKEEVSGYRDLPRIATNRLRGGMCLVLTEGLCLKASKIQKHVKNLKIEGWEFIDDYLNKVKGSQPEESREDPEALTPDYDVEISSESGEPEDPDLIDEDLFKESDGLNGEDSAESEIDTLKDENGTKSDGSIQIVKPELKYLKDLPAGRPVLAHPSQPGGFRLRYGRTRLTGLAALAIHPASMIILDSFPAIGTQVKIERPGKAGVITPCDSIEGPIVLLHSGDLVEVRTVNEIESIKDNIKSIIDIGEILIPFGEFVENNHLLMPAPYCTEWWVQELAEAKGESICAKASGYDENSNNTNRPLYPTLQDVRCTRNGKSGTGNGPGSVPSVEQAFKLSEEHNIPLHPYYNLFWHDLDLARLKKLRTYVSNHGKFEGKNLSIPKDDETKKILVKLGALHKETEEGYVIDERYSYAILRCLGMNEQLNEVRKWPDDYNKNLKNKYRGPGPFNSDTLEVVSQLAGISIKARSPTRIGARMGRPEKAKERMMSPPVHALFPIGQEGGAQRLVNDACSKSQIELEVGMRRCTQCRTSSFECRCKCGGHTVPMGNVDKVTIRFNDYCNAVKVTIGEDRIPQTKAVIGLISKDKTPEPLEKGFLRAKHKVFIFKDGTIRFDMTDVPLSHFKPSEVGTSVEVLKKLGYCYDIWGDPLTDQNQVLELKVQDVIPSRSCGIYFVKTAKFIDDLLVKFYDLEPFYNVREPKDLIGHLVIGLAPHTSGGVLSRLIGFSEANVGFAHPYYHAAKRRNCDGDEDCIILLLDGLLNFSRSFLPSSRGGQMDAPLVLTTHIDPNEIDKEAQNVDVSPIYPLAFFQATERYAHPKEVHDLIELAGMRLGREEQYEGLSYTHDVSDINSGPKNSTYKTLEKMTDKMEAQLELARKIDAVDEKDVASRVINNHFLKDMIGNLKKFTTQKLRCTKCNKKYNRIPLRGLCTKPISDVGNGKGQKICGGNLTLTVHEGGVKKYLESTKKISEKYDIPIYTRQRIALIEKAINSVFENDKVKTCKIEDFL
jgi:DNA polymerase II large subunit